MGEYPEVHITVSEEKSIPVNNGKGGRVAIIGAFKTDESKLLTFTSLTTAQLILGDDNTFDGCKCLPHIFRKDGGAESITVANITTKDTSGNWEKTLTPTKLAAALNLLVGENYDILFVAAELDDTGLTAVKNALDHAYTDKKPVGFIGGLNRTSKTELITSINIFKTGGTYGLISQPVYYDGTALDLIETSAYYAGVVSGLKLDTSMTMKQLPGVTGLVKEYTFEPGSEGLELVEKGLTVFKCQDRLNSKFVVVNSEQPNGYDLYIERVKDYIIKNLQLEDYLGLQNRSTSLKAIESRLETLKTNYVQQLQLLEDIVYVVEKASSSCVNVYIDSLKFAGIITEINVYISIEVE